jgi:hypothetical protein
MTDINKGIGGLWCNSAIQSSRVWPGHLHCASIPDLELHINGSYPKDIQVNFFQGSLNNETGMHSLAGMVPSTFSVRTPCRVPGCNTLAVH